MATFGERLSKLRKEKGLSQAEFGRLFNLGQSTIGMYETNKREPDTNTIKQFAEYFNVSTDYLLGLTNKRETPEQIIASAVSDDPELFEFWQELSKREDLQLLFKQVKPMTPRGIKKIIKIIKAIEDEEAMED